MDPVGEDKYLAARGCMSVCMCAVNCMFKRGLSLSALYSGRASDVSRQSDLV